MSSNIETLAPVQAVATASDSVADNISRDPRRVLDYLLTEMVKADGSDLVVKEGAPPLFRVHGDLIPIQFPRLTAEQVQTLVYSIVTDKQRVSFEKGLELDL